MDELLRWGREALYWYRSSNYPRQIVGGCLSLIGLVVVGIYFLFTDQSI